MIGFHNASNSVFRVAKSISDRHDYGTGANPVFDIIRANWHGAAPFATSRYCGFIHHYNRIDRFKMAQPNLGTKRVCVSCSARFYDLNRNPAVCPKCGTEQPVEAPRVRRPVEAAPESKPKTTGDALDNDVDVDLDTDEDDAADDVLADDAGLDDDDDDDDDISSADIDVKTDKDDHDN
ncbi:TIGR02300 family protein [Komagataeibacter melaceti]|uniref:TIGR02300 family protein n=2 Tax=Komagataeibacter melaceti TaxID=2766577 RepID=A0A371Z2P4_9PROT|nr:TIGR02300 family protein [Komagataeibacter melaceti]